ncbi:hypothetical protein HDV06_004422 [Boothiomyces sp. JEL0866]|nr:hypothetical protein HDV06_004422 [Boothiomyces sp. JEL0866]
MLCRLLYQVYLQPELLEGMGSTTDRMKLKGIASLISHKSDFPEEKLYQIGMMIPGLPCIIEKEHMLPPSTIIELFCAYSSNCMALCDDEWANIGVGLHPMVSLANHSCDANAFVVFNGPTAKLISSREIKEGEQIFISYISSFTHKAERQKLLKKNYLFECKCRWCTGADPFEYVVCKCGGKALNNSQCTKCQHLNNLDTIAHEPFCGLKSDEPTYLKAKKQLWITHYELYEIRKLYFEMLLKRQHYDECYKVAMEISDALVEVYGECYPLVSIYYYYVFKTAQHVPTAEAMEIANRYGHKTCVNLKMTHNGPIYQRASNEYRMFVADLNILRNKYI